MTIARRRIARLTLPLLACLASLSPAAAADALQCVPYARAQSGIRIHGDAWTWWDQAKGNYRRGNMPRPGAVLALANSDAMPLGHVAVVSRIVDERHILLRHANWSGPGVIEEDVMAVDASQDNDWSQVRIWWGQAQQMGARINPVNGFIYPEKIWPDRVNDRATLVYEDEAPATFTMARATTPRLSVDTAFLRDAHDASVSLGTAPRSLAMIVRDVRYEARLP